MNVFEKSVDAKSRNNKWLTISVDNSLKLLSVFRMISIPSATSANFSYFHESVIMNLTDKMVADDRVSLRCFLLSFHSSSCRRMHSQKFVNTYLMQNYEFFREIVNHTSRVVYFTFLTHAGRIFQICSRNPRRSDDFGSTRSASDLTSDSKSVSFVFMYRIFEM